MSTTKDAFVLNKYFYIRDKGVQFIKIVYTKTSMIYENMANRKYVDDEDMAPTANKIRYIFNFQILC